MNALKKLALILLLGFLLVVVAFDLWGALTLGNIRPAPEPELVGDANKVVMVFGATGSVGDGLLKAAMEDPSVAQIYVISRRDSPRIQSGIA
jgi:hypothetical protein